MKYSRFQFISHARLAVILALVLFPACRTVLPGRKGEAAAPDPRLERVDLAAAGGWEARLLFESDSGVWTVELMDVIAPCAGPEVVALDDRGRCVLLSLNASKVSFWQPVMDGQWLGGVARDDLDPRVPGPELYVGGKRGTLYQVVPQPQGGFNANIIAYFPGREIHTLISADLNPPIGSRELYAGLSTGELYLVDSPSEPGIPWRTVLVHKNPGRIRDAVVIEGGGRGGEAVVYVSRSGRAVELTPGARDLEEKVLYTCPQGLARIDTGETADGSRVFYAVGDDGQVMRIHRGLEGAFEREMVYAGPVGARGVAAGRFDEDPLEETVALFGYSGNVEILRRDRDGGWRSETIFTDVDKGHWLCAGELDDRNGTDEIVISGYGKRVVLLSRPPGYGL